MASRRLTRQGKLRKKQLMSEAARLFSRSGYDATRVADIVRSAGVAKGLFYWYFENKEALFKEIVASTRDDLRRTQAREIENEQDPVERIAGGITASLRFFRENQHLAVLLRFAGAQERFSSLIEEAQEIIASDTARHIEAAIAAGRIAPADPMMAAHGVVAIVYHFARLDLSRRFDQPVEELCAFVAEYCLRAHGARESERRPAPATSARPRRAFRDGTSRGRGKAATI